MYVALIEFLKFSGVGVDDVDVDDVGVYDLLYVLSLSNGLMGIPISFDVAFVSYFGG